jgi:8-oxo-dGTP diphosphatase
MRAGEAEQGVTTDRYTVVPRVLCFIRHNDEVLLLKGAPNKRLWANLYNGVGGHMERNEDPYQAAQREIFEETGLEMTALRLGGIVHVSLSSGPGVLILLFIGDTLDRGIRASKEGQLEWIRLDQLGDLPVIEDLPLILPRLLNAPVDASPFFARSYYDREGRLRMVFS